MKNDGLVYILAVVVLGAMAYLVYTSYQQGAATAAAVATQVAASQQQATAATTTDATYGTQIQAGLNGDHFNLGSFISNAANVGKIALSFA